MESNIKESSILDANNVNGKNAVPDKVVSEPAEKVEQAIPVENVKSANVPKKIKKINMIIDLKGEKETKIDYQEIENLDIEQFSKMSLDDTTQKPGIILPFMPNDRKNEIVNLISNTF